MRVIVSKLVRQETSSAVTGSVTVAYPLVPQGEALFHQFGVSYEEFETGPGNFTTAIVEWPDGRVESVPAEHVRFVTPNDEKYHELLYAVGNKHPGETRHQTALRYIQQAEASTGIEKEAAHGIGEAKP